MSSLDDDTPPLTERELKKQKRLMEGKARYHESLDKYALVKEANELFAQNYDLQVELRHKKKKITQLEFEIGKLKIFLERKEKQEQDFLNMPRSLRIKEIIRENKKVMKTQEVWNVFMFTENNLERVWAHPLKMINKILSGLVQSDELKCYRSRGTNGYYYGLPEWFDENNKIRRGFGL